ncbi:eukaryotic translation initiation factor 4 gamma 2-like [Penaeus indicus]|uniref:eukaryotic translation initiation factor 4 gamma 2-like n=1 Tax=Penaeus indicus TaxID=29960 RepID=UPI00300C8328
MYAQLCKRLSEEAPNFDPPDGPCTFNRLLLSKCQDEFERRRRASEIWDGSEGSALSAEQEEERAAAKRKMVGNLRFIGELGKLEIIHESILHRCIQQLLEKRRSRPMVDLAEDLECLCQIMKTCGKVLDKPKAKNLMDQYFERMYQLSSNMELLSRVRFMLQDVLDLRAANWVPRKVAQVDGPRTIRQVREEAAHDLGVYIPPPSSHGPPRSSGPISPLAGVSSFFPQPGGNRTGMEDVFMGAVTLGTGPGVISSQPDKYGYDSNGFGGGVSGGGSYRPRQQQGVRFFSLTFPSHLAILQIFAYLDVYYLNNLIVTLINSAESNRELGSQLLEKLRSEGLMNVDRLFDGVKQVLGQLDDLVNDVPRVKSHMAGILGHLIASGTLPLADVAEPLEGGQHFPLFLLILQTLHKLLGKSNLTQTFNESKVVYFVVQFSILNRSKSNRELGSQLLEKLRSEGLMNVDRLFDGVKQVLGQLDDLVNDVPRVKSHMAGILGHLIASGTLPLADVAEPLEGGQHFPLFLLILQTLHKLLGKSNLTQTFNESKVNLLNLLPESDRTKEKLADLLEDRELSFLFPLLRIQSDLWRALVADPTPHAFYKYIKDTLDPEHHTAPGFINALMTVLVKYIVQETTLAAGADPTTIPEKMVTEREQELLAKFKPVLQAFLHDHLPLQVTAIYALQVFTYTNNFPKGMLLRWFVNLYDLEIVEEDAFLTWKEDLSQDYPGKGKALFQVNQWLTWLQETEEDDEEDDGDA